jgi:polygalacturonase
MRGMWAMFSQRSGMLYSQYKILIVVCIMNHTNIYNILMFGAIGDGHTDNANPIQNTINTCSDKGGGIVLIPAGGIYMSGPFELKANVKLYIDGNATLLANPDEMVYTQSAFRENKGEGSIWISCKNAMNISIEGMGTIDGNGIAFMGPEQSAAFELKKFNHFDRRPHIFTAVNCHKMSIKDITFKNAAYWGIHLIGCNDVCIHGISIYNHLKIRNGDGIDLDHSRNIRISNCYIESGDDCICLKTRREYAEFGPTENIVVTNCLLRSSSCCIKLGSENMDTIRKVIFSNCIIESSNRGLGIQNRDEGSIENIIFQNIIIEGHFFDDVWWGKAEPIYVTAYPRSPVEGKDANWRFDKGQMTGKVGPVRNIQFVNIQCKSENGIFVSGEPGTISDLQFTSVKMTVEKTTTFPGGVYDVRPSNREGLKQDDTCGFYFEKISGLQVNHCHVEWIGRMEPYFSHAFYAERCINVKINNFMGHSAFPELKNPFKFLHCEKVVQQ